MSLEVPERLCQLNGPRKESGVLFRWDLSDGEVVTLPVQGVYDLIEAQEISDEWEILAIACLSRVRERPGNDVAEFADIAHVNAAHGWIKRKSPAQRSVRLLLRSERAHQGATTNE